MWNALAGHDFSPKELIEFNYRKTFGLSFEEFMNEPADVYAMNILIISQVNKYENYLNRRAEQKAKTK